MELEQRFWAKVDKTETCWLWTAATMPNGYGVADVKGREGSRLVHRIAYEWLVGPIPDGLVLDHLCRVTNCLRPDHLEPVTQAENTRRGGAVAARTRRAQLQTHCKQGHEFIAENIYTDPRGWRSCRTCRRLSDRKRTTRTNN